MRRRGNSSNISAGLNFGDGSSFSPYGHVVSLPCRLKINAVPKEWTDNAATPWRILFPDLDWTPPDRDL
jgi:hypothetical protein